MSGIITSRMIMPGIFFAISANASSPEATVVTCVYPALSKMERIVTLNAAEVDLDQAEVIREGQRTPLTAKEYSIFEKLAENAGRIVTIGVLCQTLCGEIWQGYETTLMTHIRHLREKIEENPSKPVSLLTVKGLGYKLVVKEPEK
ncbi:sensory transduction protein regX3 [Lachnospiraceae bacterium]|nr:sensory transduction protein regX3 [Lachnospiraceae bacterium]